MSRPPGESGKGTRVPLLSKPRRGWAVTWWALLGPQTGSHAPRLGSHAKRPACGVSGPGSDTEHPQPCRSQKHLRGLVLTKTLRYRPGHALGFLKPRSVRRTRLRSTGLCRGPSWSRGGDGDGDRAEAGGQAASLGGIAPWAPASGAASVLPRVCGGGREAGNAGSSVKWSVLILAASLLNIYVVYRSHHVCGPAPEFSL